MRPFTILATVVSLCFLGCSDTPPPTNLKPGTTFQIHRVAPQAGPNTKSLPDPDTGVVLNLVDPPLVTEANVSSASVATAADNAEYLDIEVDLTSAAKMQEATAATGQQLAIVVNGKIASAPIIRAPISARFKISSHSQFDWQNIVQ